MRTSHVIIPIPTGVLSTRGWSSIDELLVVGIPLLSSATQAAEEEGGSPSHVPERENRKYLVEHILSAWLGHICS